METCVCEIERLGIHDGPGIRTVVFLKGCPLRCVWCSNPETQLLKNQIYYNEKKCIGCKRCVKACQDNSLEFVDEWKFYPEKCTDINRIIQSCPVGALKNTAEKMTVDEVFDEVMKDYSYYRNSNGGLTVSGGEVLMNWEFAYELLKKVKEEYISTAIETSGFGDYSALEKIAEVTDYILFDIKHMDEKIHKEVTGVSNKKILENLEKLSKQHKNIMIRVPLLKGLNDTEENVNKTIDFVQKMKLNEIHILPYHTLGLEKYRQLKMPYLGNDYQKHTPEDLERVKEIIERNGLKCKING
jgi:pyruvate formate lyase activating enzyme